LGVPVPVRAARTAQVTRFQTGADVEKRTQSRTEIALAVVMSYGDNQRWLVTTRNVSLGGVFIEPGQYPLPRPGATVTLSMPGKTVGAAKRHMQARVARSGPEGVALVFGEVDRDEFEFIQDLMG